MSLSRIFRNLKNNIVTNKKNMLFFLRIINTIIIGDIYDFFYIKFIKKKIANLPLEITIEPNNICNLQCVMCPYKRMKRKKQTMSMKLFKRIVDEAKEIGCVEIKLSQYNEPFSDKQIFERIKYIKSKGMRVSFYSNATILNKKIREKLLENPADWIRFSVDGSTKKTFESIRVGANYEQVCENIKSLFRERNKKGQKLPVIEVYFTMLKQNKHESKEFLKQWQGNCDFASLYPVDSRESEDFVNINFKKFKPYPCFNPKEAFVLSNGKVVLCCVDINGDVVLGDLNKQSIKEIMNSKKFKETYNSQIQRRCQIPMCKRCSKMYVDNAFSWWLY